MHDTFEKEEDRERMKKNRIKEKTSHVLLYLEFVHFVKHEHSHVQYAIFIFHGK